MTIINQLKRKGYAVQKNIIPKKLCTKLGEELDKISKSSKYKKYKFHLSKSQLQILNVNYIKPDIFMKYISNKKILNVLKEVFKGKFILSNFNASNSLKSNNYKYRLHIDSRMPISNFENTTHVVANICIDDFTEKNGSTVIVKNSHKKKMNSSNRKIIKLIAPKGSIIFSLGHLWHDIGKNLNGSRRWSIIAYYCRWWIKPTYDFVRSCPKKTFILLNNSQKELLGFNSTPPIDWSLRRKTVRNTKSIPKYFSQINKFLK